MIGPRKRVGAVGRRTTARRRIILGGADQALSSGQNFLLLVLVARAVPTAELGAFTVVLTIAVAAVALCEAGVSEPALLHAAAAEQDAKQGAVSVSITCSLALGVATSGTILPIAFAFHSGISGLLLILAGVLPGLLAQDSCRLGAITHGRSGLLLALDSTWVGAWAAGLVLIDPHTAGGQLAVWGLTAWIPVIVGFGCLRFEPVRPKVALRYWRRELWPSAASLVNEYAANTASQQAAALGVAGVATLSDAGVLRATAGLYGPINIFYTAMRIVVTPEVIRVGGSRSSRGERTLLVATVTVTVATAAVAAGLWLIPAAVGQRLLGETWRSAHNIVILVGASKMLAAATTRAAIGLRADGHFRAIARNRNIVATVNVCLVLLGAVIAGYVGAAWGSAVAAAATLGIYEHSYRCAHRMGKTPRVPQDGPSAADATSG